MRGKAVPLDLPGWSARRAFLGSLR